MKRYDERGKKNEGEGNLEKKSRKKGENSPNFTAWYN